MTSTDIYPMIHLDLAAWQLLGSKLDEQPSAFEFAPDSLAKQAPLIAEALQHTGHEGEPMVLGLSASWCLTATIDVPSPQMLRKPQLLHYQLEEWLPWSAEEYVSDFIGNRGQAFCVAVRHQQLAKLLKELKN